MRRGALNARSATAQAVSSPVLIVPGQAASPEEWSKMVAQVQAERTRRLDEAERSTGNRLPGWMAGIAPQTSTAAEQEPLRPAVRPVTPGR